MADLMTADEFHKKSSHIFTRGRGPIIEDIEDLLRAYHLVPTDKPRRRLKILVLLYAWTYSYSGKRAGVRELRDAVRALLDSPESRAIINNSAVGQFSKQNGLASTGRSLQLDYRIEPLLPGKGTVPGTGHGKVPEIALRHQTKRFAMSTLAAELESGFVATTITNLKTASLSSIVEYHLSLNSHNCNAFESCDKTSRGKYQVHFKDGMLYTDQSHMHPLDTVKGSGDLEKALYALDLDQNLYCKNMSDVKFGQFHHSSFMSGKPVLCAGEVVVRNGRLTYINIASGHYKPTVGDLGGALQFLQEQTVTLDGVTVGYYVENENHQSVPEKMPANTAVTWMRNCPKSTLSES